MKPSFDLSGRTAIVTGANTGIGQAIAVALAGAGAAVLGVGRSGMSETEAMIAAAGGRFASFSADLSTIDPVDDIVEAAVSAFGSVDILVNNAGIIRRGTIETVTEEDWDQVIEVNLKGTFNCCKAVAGIMKQQGYGKIVNVSSIAGKMGDVTSAPGYGPSKAGMDALTKTLARQLAPYRINVNGVAPHAIETEMSAQWSEERRKEIIASIPLGRLGTPEDVAQAVLFLVSDDASFITGEILDVNGGALMD